MLAYDVHKRSGGMSATAELLAYIGEDIKFRVIFLFTGFWEVKD